MRQHLCTGKETPTGWYVRYWHAPPIPNAICEIAASDVFHLGREAQMPADRPPGWRPSVFPFEAPRPERWRSTRYRNTPGDFLGRKHALLEKELGLLGCPRSTWGLEGIRAPLALEKRHGRPRDRMGRTACSWGLAYKTHRRPDCRTRLCARVGSGEFFFARCPATELLHSRTSNTRRLSPSFGRAFTSRHSNIGPFKCRLRACRSNISPNGTTPAEGGWKHIKSYSLTIV